MIKRYSEMIKKDVVIIGGGPAGMAAAISLKDQGIDEVLIIEREAILGGMLNQCIHDGFGLICFEKNLTGPEYADFYERRLEHQGISYMTCAAVTEIKVLDSNFPPSQGFLKRVTAVSPAGSADYLTKAVILATGCRERPRGALSIPGTRPAGIYTAGTVQNFVNLKNLMPGKRVMILGSGDIGLIMARRMTLEGAEVIAVIEKEKTVGGLPRNVRQCLEDFKIPLILGATITNIIGTKKLEAVEVSDLNEDGGIGGESARVYSCDTLILSVGLIPEVETGLTCGIAIDEQSGEPLADQDGQTTADGVFVCGNARYVHDLVDDVSKEAENLGRTVARYIRNGSVKAQGQEPYRRASEGSSSAKSSSHARSQERNTMICLLCPKSCLISFALPEKTKRSEESIRPEIKGAMCEKGEEYILRELISPMRTLTSSVKVQGGEKQIVSVRTTAGIPKESIFEAMKWIKALKIMAPIEIGQIIEKDFMRFGVDLIATSKVL